MNTNKSVPGQAEPQHVDTFAHFWHLGYRRLVPIIPPDAKISPHSSLAKRVGTPQDSRGKAVGIKGRDGDWRGFDWLPHEADEDDLPRWREMGAGAGIKTGQGLIAIDADTLDEGFAKIIRDTITERLGRLPVRVGRYPKALYLVRVTGDYRYTRIEFGERNERGHIPHRVEILSDGRQFVAGGVHPTTQKPYTWPRALVPFDDLPQFTPDDIDALLRALAAALPEAGELIREGGTSPVAQEALKGDLETVRRAVAATPNTSGRFPSRENYRDFGYAIKAALPDHEEEAFDIFADWCARWQDDENDLDVVAADWRRMKPPFRRGAGWLYEIAEETSGGAFRQTDAWFDDLTNREDLFGLAQHAHGANEAAPEPIKWVRPSEWEGFTPKPREWEVENWIPKGEVTLLYGDGGIGKTLLAHQYATAAAAGLPWLNQPTRRAKVMCFFCEDSEEELHRRQIDINRALGLGYADIDENLRIASRKYGDNLFTLWDRNTGAMKRQAVWERLRDDAVAFGANVVIVDTIADTYGGSEIDRGQVNAFVKSCLGRLAQEIDGSVVALGHPSMSGKSTGSGTSGSTAWSNAARSRLYLRYPKGVEKGNVREIEGMKLNYGPRGALMKLRWEQGAFVLIAGTTPKAPGSENMAPSAGKSGQNLLKGSDGVGDNEGHAGGRVVSAEGLGLPAGSVEALALDVTITALKLCEGVRLSLAPNSTHYVGKVLRQRVPDVLEAVTAADVESALRLLEREGALVAVEVGKDGYRRAAHGLKVLDILSDNTPQNGTVFD